MAMNIQCGKGISPAGLEIDDVEAGIFEIERCCDEQPMATMKKGARSPLPHRYILDIRYQFLRRVRESNPTKPMPVRIAVLGSGIATVLI